MQEKNQTIQELEQALVDFNKAQAEYLRQVEIQRAYFALKKSQGSQS